VASKRKLNYASRKPAKSSAGAESQRGCFIVEKIVSGGQTGVDRAALDFAIARRIPHGGWCPRGRLAEDGAIEPCYELKETPETEYAQRTGWNVSDSDGTVIFTVAPELTGGSALTRDLAAALGKPCLHLSKMRADGAAPATLREFIRRHSIRTLNVAGPRLSTEPGACDFATQVLEELCRERADEQARLAS
jgi:hypothetical protein